MAWPVRQKYAPQVHFSGGGGGSGVRDMAPPSLRNLGAKFSETPFPNLKIYFMEISHCYL